MTFLKTTGTRAEVWHDTAKHTAGRLEKKDLIQNKWGRIVSRSKHKTASREKRLLKHGFGTKKGKFGVVRLDDKGKSKKSSTRKRKTLRKKR